MEFHVCTPGRIQLVLDLKLNMTIYSQGIPEAVNYVGYLHNKKHKNHLCCLQIDNVIYIGLYIRRSNYPYMFNGNNACTHHLPHTPTPPPTPHTPLPAVLSICLRLSG